MKIYENLDIQELNGEIWKDILDYEDDYQVSNFGRVKSLKFGKERILKQYKDISEYFKVDLCKNGISKPKLVHRLIYETFKEKLEEGYDAHHINENKECNFVENLESKPHSEHLKDHHIGKHHSEKIKKKMSENHTDFRGKNNPNHKLTEEQVIQIKLLLKEEILTQQEIADRFGVSISTISKIKN
jgi:DNA-binding CsgD family transcriptional regulator